MNELNITAKLLLIQLYAMLHMYVHVKSVINMLFVYAYLQLRYTLLPATQSDYEI